MATKYQSIGRDFIFLIDQIENLEKGHLKQMIKAIL